MNVDMQKAEGVLWNFGGKKFFQRRVSQYPVDLILWEVFLNLHADIASIVEIGSQDGGSSLFLALQAYQRGMEFRTFDIVHSAALEECFDTPLARIVGLREKFVHGDIFADSREILARLLDGGLPRPLLLFCDGPRGAGGSPSEIREYVPRLEPGDYWATHDWADSRDEKGEVFPDDVAWMGDGIEPLHWDVWRGLGSITRFWRVVAKLGETEDEPFAG